MTRKVSFRFELYNQGLVKIDVVTSQRTSRVHFSRQYSAFYREGNLDLRRKRFAKKSSRIKKLGARFESVWKLGG